MYTGGIWGVMIAVSAPQSVRAVVVVFPWPVLHVLFGVCVTVAPVPIFSVSFTGGFVMPSIVIFCFPMSTYILYVKYS